MHARNALIVIAMLLVAQTIARAQPADVSRVLRMFDFEERRLGNVEDLPMHWSKVDGNGLPHYVNGRLSTDRARSGKYSFRFELNGGSLVYRYRTGQIKVMPDAHYRVEGFVQTSPMPHARARMTAYFTDVDGHTIEASTRHSQLFASAAEADSSQWHRIAVELSADAPGAAFLVVELGLLQPVAYSWPVLGKQSLFPQDIQGVAWFDDIAVSQVPQVTLATSRPGNVFRRGDVRELSVVVNDRFTDDLSAQLVVRDADNKLCYQKSGALEASADNAQNLGPGRKRVTLSLPHDLPAGWYQASLEMSSQGQFVGRQSIDFVLLADDGKPLAPDARFGLIATALPIEGWSELPEILPTMSAGRVKLGVWSEQGDVQQMGAGAFDRLLEQLRELNVTPTACLLTLPLSVREKMRAKPISGLEASTQPSDARLDTREILKTASEDPWLQILKAPAETWQPQLAYLIARHANHLERWQLGDDGSDVFVAEPRMREVYQRILTEFNGLMQQPDLAMPWPAWYELSGELPATIALHVKPDVLPNQLPLYMQDIIGDSALAGVSSSSATNLSIYLEPLDRAHYGRELQIRDLAQRIAYALSADARRIDIRLPYTVQRDGDTLRKQPQELFIIVRTILRTLGNATFKGKVPIAEGIEAFLFDRNGEGILMLWDRGSGGSAVRQLAINLGQRPLRVDLWGNVSPMVRTNHTPTSLSESATVPLELGPMPIFLVGIDAQLAQLRASIAFDNDRIESSFKAHTRRLRFTNPYRSAIAGSVKLTAPKGWTINPPSQTFTLNPGETFDREMTVEFPYNSFAGPKTITADFQVQSETNERFTVPLVLKLGLSDVGLQTIALRDGKDVIVQQMITNYGDKPIAYTAYAMYPGQARQERLVTNLAPGRTTIKKYRFNQVAITANAKVRSGVKELVGTRVLNDEVAIQ